jgi:WD40 repeat protein
LRVGARTIALATGAVTDARFVDGGVVLATRDGVRAVARDGAVVASAAAHGAGDLDVSIDGRALLARTPYRTLAWALPALTLLAELPAAGTARFDRNGDVVLGDATSLRRVRLASPASADELRAGETPPLVRLIDGELAAGNELVDVAARTTRVFAPAVSAIAVTSLDRAHAITGGFDRTLRVFDLERTARPLAILSARDATKQIVASGTRAASIGWHDTIELWDVGHLRQRQVIARGGAGIISLVRGGDNFAALQHDGDDRVAIVRASGQRVGDVPGWPVGFAGDELVVVDHGRVAMYATRDAAPRRVVTDAAPIRVAALSPSGALLATAAGGYVAIRDVRTGVARAGFQTHLSELTLAIDDADHVITGEDDGTLRIWDARAGVVTATLRGHGAHVDVLAIRGGQLMTASWDQTIRTWAFPSGAPGRIVLEDVRGAVALSPDGRLFADVDHAPMVNIRDTEHGRLLEQIATLDPVDAVLFVDDTHVAVGGVGGTLEVIDLADPERDDETIARLAGSQRP